MASSKLTTEQRFWAKVDKDGPQLPGIEGKCWAWTACKCSDGYGNFLLAGKQVGAHRVAWELDRGTPPGSLCVLHHCDNPPCVNPMHLFLGTHQDNADDKVRKGRHVAIRLTGEDNPRARLRLGDVIEIRRMGESGSSTSAIAQAFGIAVNYAADILSGRSWAHVPIGRQVWQIVVKGELQGCSKLTEAEVRHIRESYDRSRAAPGNGKAVENGFLPELARKYQVSVETVSEIGRRKSWKHLP